MSPVAISSDTGQASALAPAAPPAVPASPSLTTAGIGKPSVLVVDDERLHLDTLHGLLKDECRVLVATSGEAALKAAAQHCPDLILLDVNMPGMNGYEVCARLKEHDATHGTPVIFITALADASDESRGFELGAVDYITKPFNPSVVRARVRTHLRLKQLNDIGTALMAERDLDRLLEMILLTAKDITHADGGTLYTVSDDRQRLQFRIVRTESLNIALGGTTGTAPKFADLPLYKSDGQPNNTMVAAHVALTGRTANIVDAYEETAFDFSGMRKFDASTGYRSKSFLTVPMRNHEGDIIGVLQLINAVDRSTGEVGVFTAADQRVAESLAAQAAMALTNRQLIQQLEGLFEGFIQLIGTAIDEKSPYTGGHCQRVPELTMMLAEAADASAEGPLADFRLTDKDRYELRIASMLHDCGKVTTPVHVVDKATKLETLFDRIELVATRFEVARREAETAMWRDIAQGMPQAQARATFESCSAQIDADLAFIRQANKGSERMSEDDVQRVHAIAQRYAIDGRPFFSDEELENLSIRAGTLTAAERAVINHHIVATIQMLERLPWPRHLSNVPEYAGGHHERMDGKGYPKGLTREQMSLQARMMGIADIFEALTAQDRPYKAPMKISQALQVMDRFRDHGHIDPDLYEVFLKQQVAQRYARKFLPPEQLDA